MQTTMIVSGIRIQSATKYDLLKNPATGFRMITVTKDADGLAPPPLGGAAGSKNASLADTIVSSAVWDELNVAIRRFPFTANITHDAAGNVTDLTFETVVSGSFQSSADTRAIRQLLERVLVNGEVEWVVRPRGLPHYGGNGRDSETLGLDPTGTDGFRELE
jgi:hypothetical protein